jgi:steroid delta-isomerase-like uncharacterized protein
MEAVASGDSDAVAALYAEPAPLHHPLFPQPARGRAAIRAAEQELFDSFSDIEVELSSVLAGQSTCAAEVILRATNTGPIDLGGDEPVAATHKRIEEMMVWVFDVGDDGLIIEERDYVDTAGLMRQLGLGQIRLPIYGQRLTSRWASSVRECTPSLE